MTPIVQPVDSRVVNRVFGANLKKSRRIRGLTQSQLAERLGFSRVTIANLESGAQNVQLHQLFAAADALDVRVESLLPTRADFERELEIGRVRSDRLELSDILFLKISHDQLLAKKGFDDENSDGDTGSGELASR